MYIHTRMHIHINIYTHTYILISGVATREGVLWEGHYRNAGAACLLRHQAGTLLSTAP